MGRSRGPRLPRPPSAVQARKAFREALLEPDGTFISVRHFKERMAQRQFDLNDVGHVARTGRIHNPPEWDMAHGEWTWRIEGQAVDGRTAYVVFGILGEKTVRGITIETPER
jgi:hypothetical protein